jgi:hypothetical protein
MQTGQLRTGYFNQDISIRIFQSGGEKMRGKTWKLAAVTLGLSISAAAAVYAQTPGWSLTGEGWRYMSVEGQYQAARWFQDTDGRWYHFDQSGIMQTGWFQDGSGLWYFLATDTGAMKTGWHQDPDGKWYFLAYSGAMQTGLIKVDQKVYYMEPSGALFTGDKEINGVIYHFTENGTVGSVPPVPTAQVWSANGNQTSGSDSSSSREKVRVRDAVQNDIIDAVNQTSGSEHIASASISGQSISVTPVAVSTMLEGLPAAQSVFEVFLSSGYINEVTISGPGGSAVVHEAGDLVGAARSLGFSGSGSFSQARGSYTVTVSYSGTLDYGYEDGTLVYSVAVN